MHAFGRLPARRAVFRRPASLFVFRRALDRVSSFRSLRTPPLFRACPFCDSPFRPVVLACPVFADFRPYFAADYRARLRFAAPPLRTLWLRLGDRRRRAPRRSPPSFDSPSIDPVIEPTT